MSKNCMSLHPALTKKNQTVDLLQSELQNYQNIRDQYSRALDQKNALQHKIQSQYQTNEQLKKHHQDIIYSHNQRIDELKTDLEQLEKELGQKSQKLKQSKRLGQELQSYYDQCGGRVREQVLFHDQTKNMDGLTSAEKQRILEQQCSLNEQVKKCHYTQINIKQSIDKIKDKIYSFKNYIRELLREQKKIQDSLMILEEENNSIDAVNTQYQIDLEQISKLAKQVKDQIEERKITLKTRELEEGRIRKKINETIKLRKMEVQKLKNLQQKIEEKTRQCQKVTALEKETRKNIEKERDENEEVLSINLQLRKDLLVCQKHLENLTKNNNFFKNNLLSYNETNKIVIKKLEKVGNDENLKYTWTFSDKDHLEATNDGFGISNI